MKRKVGNSDKLKSLLKSLYDAQKAYNPIFIPKLLQKPNQT